MPTPLFASFQSRQDSIAVIGLGYVGLPLAVCLARHYSVIGLDRDPVRISQLQAGEDRTGEIDAAALRSSGLTLSADPAVLDAAGLFIITVPTPVDPAKRPDLSALHAASITVGQHIRRGGVVVYESTVYPGCTEEVCIPLIIQESGLQAGRDFTYGYSPERINPGDRQRSIECVRKVVSASDGPTLDLLANIYGTAIPAGIYRASSVRVAEAAKVIENTQRDLNIALVNEIALICHRLGLDTLEVLEAAGTKWNFLPFRPGLVGGHCIGVDPYYLTHKAEAIGYHPDVILAGRRINDAMGTFIAQECIRLLVAAGRPVLGGRVLILGLTFKEDCSDVRNTRVVDIITELKRFGMEIVVVDPHADPDQAHAHYGLKLAQKEPLPACTAIIAAVAHRCFADVQPAAFASAAGPGAPFLDVKGQFDRAQLAAAGLSVWRL